MVDFPALGMLVCRFAWSFRYQSRNVVMWSGVPVRNDCCVSMPQSKIEDNWGTWKTKIHGQMTWGYIKDPTLPLKVSKSGFVLSINLLFLQSHFRIPINTS